MITHDANKFPWLTSVYVSPGFRSRGIGSYIVRSAVEEVEKLGFQKLFLVTIEKADFFRKLGWEDIHSTNYGQTVTIMEKQLNISPLTYNRQDQLAESTQQQNAKFLMQ